jgi:prepilin-type processing-associated H-X9-DG protein
VDEVPPNQDFQRPDDPASRGPDPSDLVPLWPEGVEPELPDPPPAGKPAQPPPPPSARPASSASVIGLIYGIVSIFTFGVTSISGIILSIIGLRQAHRTGGRVGGRRLAVAGLVTSIAGLFIGLTALTILVAIGAVEGRAARSRTHPWGNLYTEAEVTRRSGQSILSLKVMTAAALGYADEHHGRLPLSDEFPLGLARYINGRKVPSAPAGRALAMNASLSGMRLSDIDRPQWTVLFFESQAPGPVVGGSEILRALEGAGDSFIIGFADGHVEEVAPEDLDDLIWHPDKGPSLVKTWPSLAPREYTGGRTGEAA